MKDADKTIPQIFWSRMEASGSQPLFLYSEEGDFPPYTYRGRRRVMSWAQVGAQVQETAMGLLALGAEPGDCICIMSSTRPEWVIADLALLSIGCRTGSIYANNLPSQARYIINDLEATYIFTEGEKNRDGLLALKASLPKLKKIITIGCDAGEDPDCLSFRALQELGAAEEGRLAALFMERLYSGRLSDIASFIYTSGTTGIPRGAVHTHESITYTVCTGSSWLPIEAGWVNLSFLPMAHIFEQFAGPFLDIYLGNVVTAFARSIDTIARDFAFVKPHYTRTAPRLLEKVYSTIWSKIELLATLSPTGFDRALETARAVRVGEALEGKPSPEKEHRKLEELDQKYFSSIRELVFGGNLQFMVAGGAPLSKDINEFFHSLGLPVYELYGMTETGGATTNRPGANRPGTVGQKWPTEAWPGLKGDVTVTAEGEIIMKGPNIMLGYHNKPEETAEAIRYGWLYSGDIAELDEDGYFRITDRKKDIIITAGGKNIAPIAIESMLKEDPLISQAAVYGDRKKYLTALITLDAEELKALARKLGLEGSYKELTSSEQIHAEVKNIVDKMNKRLARFETIKDFILLDHDLSIETGDLTPTMKVRRRAVFKKYGGQLEELYTQS